MNHCITVHQEILSLPTRETGAAAPSNTAIENAFRNVVPSFLLILVILAAIDVPFWIDQHNGM
ncbi:MAG: hypothetical protein JW884_03470 [Deltaproteobacteria bacterium]|nr:hypothetical protein [Deltaproteobacteria bacterium]